MRGVGAEVTEGTFSNAVVSKVISITETQIRIGSATSLAFLRSVFSPTASGAYPNAAVANRVSVGKLSRWAICYTSTSEIISVGISRTRIHAQPSIVASVGVFSTPHYTATSNRISIVIH